MARNRKSQSAGLRLGAVLKAGVICAVIVTCCVGYVWQKQQINLLAKQVGEREARLLELRDQNGRLEAQRAQFERPEYLERRIKELNLGLGLPRQNQIWRLPEPPVAAQAMTANATRQYAADQTRPSATSR